MSYISNGEKETAQVAADFIKNLKPNKKEATIVGLYGELGSGKTTFMKYIAKALGVKETIQSPTFVLMKSYKLKAKSYKLLFHIDAYRIEKDEEMLNLGWREIISDPQNLVFIEWPDRIASITPPHIVVRFEHGQGENQRKISTS